MNFFSQFFKRTKLPVVAPTVAHVSIINKRTLVNKQMTLDSLGDRIAWEGDYTREYFPALVKITNGDIIENHLPTGQTVTDMECVVTGECSFGSSNWYTVIVNEDSSGTFKSGERIKMSSDSQLICLQVNYFGPSQKNA